MYLAKAHYKKKDFQLCKKLTINLMVHYPEDLRLKFNLAVCLYKEGNIIFNLNRRKVKQTLYAINNLKQAKSLMRSLLGALRAAGNLGHSAFWSSTSEQMRNQQNYEQVHKNFQIMQVKIDELFAEFDSMLASAELYLVHDRKFEESALAKV